MTKAIGPRLERPMISVSRTTVWSSRSNWRPHAKAISKVGEQEVPSAGRFKFKLKDMQERKRMA